MKIPDAGASQRSPSGLRTPLLTRKTRRRVLQGKWELGQQIAFAISCFKWIGKCFQILTITAQLRCFWALLTSIDRARIIQKAFLKIYGFRWLALDLGKLINTEPSRVKIRASLRNDSSCVFTRPPLCKTRKYLLFGTVFGSSIKWLLIQRKLTRNKNKLFQGSKQR